MGKEHFQFDPALHRFVPIQKNRRQKFVRFGLYAIAILIISFLFRYTSDHYFTHPKEIKLLAEKEALIDQYTTCEKKIRELESEIAGIQTRDDNIYRSYYELDPVPASIREAGLGGSERYSNLQGYGSSGLMIRLTQRVDLLDIRMEVQSKSYQDLLRKADMHTSLMKHKPAIQPISLQNFYWISSVYGYRIDPISKRRAMHRGVDFAAAIGTNVYSTGDGIVKSITISRGGYGKEIVIEHGFGYTTRYGHLHSILVHKGQKIQRGMIVGTLGDTGKSTGPHLHYEVRLNNRTLNPKHYYAEDLTAKEYAEIVSLPEAVDN